LKLPEIRRNEGVWMKKILIIIGFCLLFCTPIFAELIDGPANIRESPNSKVLFSLNNYTNVQSKVYDNKWNLVSVTVWVKNSDIINGKTIKKNTILFDYQGNEIGQTVDLITPNNNLIIDCSYMHAN
jgi:hypothetical protein